MLNSVLDDISRDAEKRRLERLEAMRQMFEEDRGRSAVTMEELRDWMGAQYLDRLKIRMNHHLPSSMTSRSRSQKFQKPQKMCAHGNGIVAVPSNGRPRLLSAVPPPSAVSSGCSTRKTPATSSGCRAAPCRG
jgi:hypothetical protein